MLERWRRKRANREVVDRVYDALVQRARRPTLYLDGGLPDTVMGRYEALGMEVLVFLDRCREDPALTAFSQDLVDRFMLDMDHSLREIGIGYQGVPRRMRRLANRFYTRVAEFGPPLAARDREALAAAIAARAFGDEPAPEEAAGFLADHMIRTADAYRALGADAILRGELADRKRTNDDADEHAA